MTTCTVAIPVYNRRDLVSSALESALAQDLPGLDILVVDNCSDDGTWEVLQRYGDPRVRLVRNGRNLGLFGNFNRCLALARGTYLRFLCSDDALTDGCLRREVALMERYPAATLLTTRGRIVRPDGSSGGIQAGAFRPGVYAGADAVRAALWCQLFYGRNALNYPSGVLMRRDAAMRAGPFDERLRVTGDVDFFFRVLRQGAMIASDAVGCEIGEHAGQVGPQRARDGTLVREYLELLRRFEPMLAPHAATLRRQVPGAALWLALAFWRRGLLPESALHCRLALALAPLPIGLVAFGTIALRRALLALSGLWLLPLHPTPASSASEVVD